MVMLIARKMVWDNLLEGEMNFIMVVELGFGVCRPCDLQRALVLGERVKLYPFILDIRGEELQRHHEWARCSLIFLKHSLFGAVWWDRLVEVVQIFSDCGWSDMGGLIGLFSFRFCIFCSICCRKNGMLGFVSYWLGRVLMVVGSLWVVGIFLKTDLKCNIFLIINTNNIYE